MTEQQKNLKRELKRLNGETLKIHSDRNGKIWITPIEQGSHPKSFKLPIEWAVCPEGTEFGYNETKFHHIYLRGANPKDNMIGTIISQDR